MRGGPGNGLLLDTHAFLWWAANDDRLSEEARETIAEDRVVLSVGTPWEMTIKHALGRLELRDTPRTLVTASSITAEQLSSIRERIGIAVGVG